MSINDFIYTYFILPYEANQGYNLVNSLTYGIILLCLLYLLNRAFHHYKFRIKNELVYATLSFILFGSTLRVLEDAGTLPRTMLLVTPFIYLWVMIITVSVITLAYKFTKKPERNILITGLALSAINISFIRINNWDALILITTISLGITLALGLLRKKFGLLKNNLNFLGIAGHMLDATATFVTIDLFSYLGYWEQHPIPRLVGTLGGSYAWFYILKLFVIIVLYYIDKDVRDENFKKILKFVVIVLGFAPGIRDTLRISMLV